MTWAPCPDCVNCFACYEDPDPGACGCGSILVDAGCLVRGEDTLKLMADAELKGECPYFEERKVETAEDYGFCHQEGEY